MEAVNLRNSQVSINILASSRQVVSGERGGCWCEVEKGIQAK